MTRDARERAHGAASGPIRHGWCLEETEAVYTLPLPELLFRAQAMHRVHHDPLLVQARALLSVKTGGCAEDCAYCPQSSRYQTGVERRPLMSVEDALAVAESARSQGATRFCMGAAWRSAPRGAQFERVLAMVRGVHALGSDRCGLLRQLAAQNPHPESVPINALVRVPGTPLADADPLDPVELVRTIATARILMPRSIVRLSAGRLSLAVEAQALCFLAGASSILI